MKLEELRARLRTESSDRCACCGEPCDELICSAKWNDRSAVCAWCFETCYDVLPGAYDHRANELGIDVHPPVKRCACCARAALEPYIDRKNRITCEWCAYQCYDAFVDSYVHTHVYKRLA